MTQVLKGYLKHSIQIQGNYTCMAKSGETLAQASKQLRIVQGAALGKDKINENFPWWILAL